MEKLTNNVLVITALLSVVSVNAEQKKAEKELRSVGEEVKDAAAATADALGETVKAGTVVAKNAITSTAAKVKAGLKNKEAEAQRAQAFEHAKEAAGEVATAVGDLVKEGAQALSEVLQEKGHEAQKAAADVASSAADTVKHKADSAAHSAKQTVDSAAHSAKHAAQTVRDHADHAAREVEAKRAVDARRTREVEEKRELARKAELEARERETALRARR